MTMPRRIVDAHQHLWDPARNRLSWLRSVPPLDRRFGLDDYARATAGAGIVASVYLETDVDEPEMLAEARHALALAEAPENRIAGVVAAGRPEFDGFGAWLEQIAHHPMLKGLRRVLHTQPDGLGETPRFAQNVRALAAFGLSFDVCVRADQLPTALYLARECPDVTLVLDHCGNPRVRERELDPWRGRMRELSRHPNVVCKISGIVVNADREHWSAADLRPYVEHCIECFGWDRVLFGSDWPVCTLAAPLTRWLAALAEIVGGESEDRIDRLFFANAARIYRLAV